MKVVVTKVKNSQKWLQAVCSGDDITPENWKESHERIFQKVEGSRITRIESPYGVSLIKIRKGNRMLFHVSEVKEDRKSVV